MMFLICIDCHCCGITTPMSSFWCMRICNNSIWKNDCISHRSSSGLTRVDGVMYRSIDVSLVNNKEEEK